MCLILSPRSFGRFWIASLPAEFRNCRQTPISTHWAEVKLGGSQTVFSVLTCTIAAESCGSCLRRGQARRHLTENLLVVSGYCPLHMDTSALHACFLRQSLELSLKKDFQLLRCQEGNGNSRGLATPGLDSHAVWGFGRLRFWSHAIHPFSGATKAAGKLLAF